MVIMNKITPFRIVAYYLLFSGLWIFFSDLFLLKITANTSIYSVLSIAKGWIFLIVTGTLLYWLISHYDLQQRRAKEGLRMSENKFETLFNSAGDAIFIVDFQGHILEVNDAACERLGYRREELLQLTPADLDTPEYAALVVQRISKVCQNGRDIFETAHVRRDGTVIPTEISCRIIEYEDKKAILAICRDITERKQAEKERQKAEEDRSKLQEQLFQAQKMEAIGQIAGGIAHDFNNMLSAMMGYITLIQLKSKPEDPAKHYLDQLLSLTERGATLTSSLLAFSRKQMLDMKPASLNGIVGRTGKLLKRVIGEDITLNLKLLDGDVVVNADSIQIEHALMNLATNARDAMPDGGTLTISVGHVEMEDDFIKMHGYGKPGRYAVVSVQDTGTGMDEQTRGKIFEPFFTTKGVGKGTGLGLAMVYGIIKQHDGFINVYSEVGNGTTFRIYLPAIDTEVVEAEAVENMPGRGGTETILLVEDEASLRHVTRSMLEEFGYRVIEAEDGNDAVNKFREHMAEIDLVLMDVVMPQKSGKDAYLEMQEILPDVKVILSSGHSGDILTCKRIAEEGLNFISKPILPRELFDKIREVLDKPAA